MNTHHRLALTIPIEEEIRIKVTAPTEFSLKISKTKRTKAVLVFSAPEEVQIERTGKLSGKFVEATECSYSVFKRCADCKLRINPNQPSHERSRYAVYFQQKYWHMDCAPSEMFEGWSPKRIAQFLRIGGDWSDEK